MAESLRAVVLGASGIGKHHVKWLMRAGCDVAGFLGTSTESVATTEAMLREIAGFEGRGYTSLAQLIGDCRPQVASVCTPMDAHYEHVLACLGAGCSVLCEKPLVGGEALSHNAQLYLAERLVETAAATGSIFAVNTQYAAAAPHLLGICVSEHTCATPVTSYFMQMESRGGGGTREFEAIWHDLVAHPLSVLLALVPDGEVLWETVECVLQSQRNECSFRFARPEGPACNVRILLQNVPEGPMKRQFIVDGVNVQYEGRNDEDGVYCSYLSHDGTETKATDFMEESITRFASAAAGEGEVLATGATGLRNLELQLRLLEKAERR